MTLNLVWSSMMARIDWANARVLVWENSSNLYLRNMGIQMKENFDKHYGELGKRNVMIISSSSKNSTHGSKLHRMNVDGSENAMPSQNENMKILYNEFDEEDVEGVMDKYELDTYLEEAREKKDDDGF
ncbi:hypothetical protein V6N13_041528 [Hibiscus sabdariffa]